MSTTSISSNNSYLSMTQMYSQPKQDLLSLASALNSGNVGSAQTALTTFQQDLANFQNLTGGSGLSANLKTDLQQLQGALNSNNPVDAKADFANFLQDLQRAKGHRAHHHHHHHGAGAQNGAQNTNNSTGTNVNITA